MEQGRGGSSTRREKEREAQAAVTPWAAQGCVLACPALTYQR